MLFELIDASKALLTPLIALIALFIAYQQFKMNKLKVKIDVFARRLELYEATRSLLAQIVREGKIDFENALQYARDTSGARFLVGKDVTEYLKEIHSRCIDLASAQDQLYGIDSASTSDRPALIQFEPLAKHFEPYISISKLK